MFPGLMLTLVTVAAGVVPRPVETALRDNSGVDWEQVRARTREVEAAEARHRALQWPGVEEAVGGRVRLQSAQGSHEDISEELERWVRPGALSEELLKDQQGAAVELEALGVALAASRTRVEEHLKAVEEELAGSRHQEELRERVRRQRQWVEERSKEVEDLAAQAAAALRAPEASFFEKLRRFSFQTRREEAAGLLERLRTRLQEWVGRSNGVVGAELTYVQGGVSAAALPTGEVKPAYLSGGGVLPTLEDTSREREVELSPEVQAQAKHLGSAKAAYEFVKNQTRLEWYHGAMKGSRQTLRDLRGNDADLSTLLVALLRAQGTPARYVRGTVELGLEQLAGAMGLLSSQEADQLDAALGGGPAFTLPGAAGEKVLAILTASGVPYEVVKAGGQVVGVRMERIWVEAYVSYADYRGVGEGQGARQWVPLEPALTARAKAAVRAPVVDVLGEWSETPASLTEAYLQGSAEQSPLGFFKQRVEQYLAANKPGLKYEQVLRTVEVRPERLAQLPGSLPYKVVAVQEEVPFLPESVQQRVRLTARDESGELLKVELPLHRLTGHRTVLGYKPAEAVDEEAVSLAGGLYEAPASLVNVRPVLRVDGREVAVGTRGVRLGSEHTWTLEVLLPGGTVRRMDNRILAGNFVALGVGSPGNGYQSTDEARSVEDLDGKGVRFLYERAAQYVNAWTAGEEELARLVQVVAVRPTANFAFVQNQLQVHSTLGVPQRLEWRGLEVDADFRAMTPVELVAGRGKALARLSGYEGSYQEARTLAVGTREEAVSSTSVLQAARAQNIEILALTPQNQAQELTKLEASAEVLRDVTDLLALGRHVLIPAKPVTVRDWSGTGFIANDPATEEGGYFLSGRISGAETVVRVDWWAEQELVDALKDPSLPLLETDTSKVAHLVKVQAGDFQRVVVGQVAALPLKVIAATRDGRRVKGAQVTFSRYDLGKAGIVEKPGELEKLLSGTAEEVLERIHGLPDSVTVLTGEDGVATVYVTPDPSIIQHAIASSGEPELQLVGLNEVMASVPVAEGTLKISEPFRVKGRPEAPARLVPRQTQLASTVARLELGYPLGVRVVDKFGNMLANQQVTWKSSDTLGRYLKLEDKTAQTDLRVRWLDLNDVSTQVPALTQHTPMDGEVRAEFIPGSPGLQTLTAEVDSVSQSWPLSVMRPAAEGMEGYVFRVVTQRGTLFHGIYDTPLNSPVVGMVLRWSNGQWAALTGKEQGLEEVKVQLVVKDEQDKELLREERSPFELSDLPHDDASRVVFRPKYLLRNGVQYMTFTASVKKQGQEQRVCCDNDLFFLNPASSQPRLSVTQVKTTLEQVELKGEPPLANETKELVLTLGHSSDFPVYLKVTQTIGDGKEAKILTVSGPDSLDRHPKHADLIKVPAAIQVQKDAKGGIQFNSIRFPFPVEKYTQGGNVRLDVFVVDYTKDGQPVGDTPVASKTVSVAARPRIHFADKDGIPMNFKGDDSLYVVGMLGAAEYLAGERRNFTMQLLPEPTDGQDYEFILASFNEKDEREKFISIKLDSKHHYKSDPLNLVAGYVSRSPLVSSPPIDLGEDVGKGPVSMEEASDAGFTQEIEPKPKASEPGTLVATPGSTLKIFQKSGPSISEPSTSEPSTSEPSTSEPSFFVTCITNVFEPSCLVKGISISALGIVDITREGFPPRVKNPAALCIGDDRDSTFMAEGPFLYMMKWEEDVPNGGTPSATGIRITSYPYGAEVKLSPPTAVGTFRLKVGPEGAWSPDSWHSATIEARQFKEVKVRVMVLMEDKEDQLTLSSAARKEKEVLADIQGANNIWRQVCFRFKLVEENPINFIPNTYMLYGSRYPFLTGDKEDETQLNSLLAIDVSPVKDYIEVYYRARYLDDTATLGTTDPPTGSIVCSKGNGSTPEIEETKMPIVIAHELGHVLGLNKLDTKDERGAKIGYYPKNPTYYDDGKDEGHSRNEESLMHPNAATYNGVDITREELDRVLHVNRLRTW